MSEELPPMVPGEGEKKSQVISLVEKRKEKRGKEAGPDKHTVYRSIIDVIHGKAIGLPEFPEKFTVIQAPSGVRNILAIDTDDVVREVEPEYLRDALLCYTGENFPGLGDYALRPRHATEIAMMWTAETKPVARPAAVKWADEPGLCFRRLPWPMAAGKSWPTFKELLQRCSNAVPLSAWIGSLFVEGADRQTYVWIHGKGLDGKGALARFLARAFGQAGASLVVPSAHGDRFWTHQLLHKRFCYFPDCNRYGFPATGEFKALTGGDRIRIEPKHRTPYDADLAAMFMFLSNERPALSSERADLRRVIYCEMSTVQVEADPAYEGRLWAEGGHFLAACRELYLEMYPNLGPIKTDQAEILEWVATVEQPYEALLENHFVLDLIPRGKGEHEGSFTPAQREAWVTGAQLEGVCAQARLSKPERISFLAWLERTHGIKRVGVRFDAATTRRVYRGLIMRGAAPFVVGSSGNCGQEEDDPSR